MKGVFQLEIAGKLSKFPYSFYYQEYMPEELINIMGIFAQAQDPEEIIKALQKRGNELNK